MTLSPQARCENFDEALTAFLKALGDRPLRSLDISQSDYPSVCRTTWTELAEHGFLEDLNANAAMYRLTGPGYAEALKVSGRSDERWFQEDLGCLCKVLKDALCGRSEDEFIPLQVAATNSGLTEAFVENAIDADLIWEIFGKVGAHWSGEHLIRVPHNFGLPPMA
jgi:hypothetical protein